MWYVMHAYGVETDIDGRIEETNIESGVERLISMPMAL